MKYKSLKLNRLTDKFSNELKRYQMICFYCATVVDENTVNSICQANNRSQLPSGCKCLTTSKFIIFYSWLCKHRT